jgi:hypothetical protein
MTRPRFLPNLRFTDYLIHEPKERNSIVSSYRFNKKDYLLLLFATPKVKP